MFFDNSLGMKDRLSNFFCSLESHRKGIEIRISIYLLQVPKNEMIKSEVPLLMTIITKDLSAKPFI